MSFEWDRNTVAHSVKILSRLLCKYCHIYRVRMAAMSDGYYLRKWFSGGDQAHGFREG